MSNQTEYAYNYIKSRILDGTYRPSQKLTESELSEAIGVSRNTVKKALLKLEQENLVKVENNKGASIKSFTFEEVVNYLEIREVLEGLISRSAAESITEAELGVLEQLLKQMEGFLKEHNFDEYSKLNKEFHNVIYKASKNVQAVEMVNMIKTQLLRFQFRTLLIPGRNHNSFSEHTRIFNALKAHNPSQAEEAVQQHISNVRKTIASNYHILA